MMMWRILVLSCIPAAFAQSNLERATLSGIKKLRVAIEFQGESFAKEGLTAAALQGRAEDRLREAGIQVDSAAAEFVGVVVQGLRAGRTTPLAFDVELFQVVVLDRDKTTRTVAATWSARNMLLTNTKRLVEDARDVLDGLMNQLIAAWRAANAAPQP